MKTAKELYLRPLGKVIIFCDKQTAPIIYRSPCVFLERSVHLLGKIVVFVRTEYREYLFLEKTALAVIGWEHILGLTLQS